MSIICSLKNINLSFGTKRLFKNASFQINHGDKIGLIGLNGMGKSSLFKILTTELIPDISQPPFLFDKASFNHGATKSYSVFSIDQKFQNIDVSIADYFYLYYPQFKTSKGEQLDYSKEEEHWSLFNSYESYLKSLGLQNIDLNVKHLSGGEQKKILLSLGLSSSANLILWDEPTNHLDLETIDFFESELLKSQKSLVIISHDRYLLSRVCNKIFHINDSKITNYSGNYSDYLLFLNIKEELRLKTLQKLQNSLKRETDWMRQGIKARGTRSKKRVEGFHDLSSKLSKVKGEAKRSIELTINHRDKKSKKLITCKELSFKFESEKNDHFLFKNINFEIFKGDKIGILGGNGVGKSTLMNILAGNIKVPDEQLKIADLLKICFFSQKREDMPMDKTPKQLLGNGEDFIHFNDGQFIHVTSYFRNFLFDSDEIDRPLSSFSGGELNRLQLAVNLKNEADLWIFDEPTNDLDIESIEILEKKLSTFSGNVIVISHDRTFLENVTNKIWLINNSKIEVFSSGYSQVAPYLEACKLEEKLLKENIKANSNRNEHTGSKNKKITKIQRVRLEELPQIIEKIELEVDRLDQRLLDFNYSNLTASETTRLEDTTKLKSALEDKLLLCYDEVESLDKLEQ